MQTKSPPSTRFSAALKAGEHTEPRFNLADYAVLMKPRVMSLVVFTALVGLLLAPGSIDPWTATAAIVFIALGAGAAGAINMWYDRDIDLQMSRTMNRPLPAGRMQPGPALAFGIIMALAAVSSMAYYVNLTSATLLLVTILYYVFIYTVWLKRLTPQNIVIGGVSGALPPVVGWASVTGGIDADAAPFLGACTLSTRRLRSSRRTDAAGRSWGTGHKKADDVLHCTASTGDTYSRCNRNIRHGLRRSRADLGSWFRLPQPSPVDCRRQRHRTGFQIQSSPRTVLFFHPVSVCPVRCPAC